MELLNQNSQNNYRLFSTILFSFLFVYILLRAYFVSPMHDEIATLLHYVEPGIYYGENVVLDANNHLLNSAICTWIYNTFGDNLFLLRLPNVLAFALYFYALYRILNYLKNSNLKIIFLLGISTIPFILEYFAMCRGYGLSFGFLAMSMCFIIKTVHNQKLANFIGAHVFILLAIYANLSLIPTAFLLMLLLLMYYFLYLLDSKWIYFWQIISLHIAVYILLLPAISFSSMLRESGALYYGSLNGFWRVTGKSLSKYILFYDANWLKYIALLFGLSLTIYLIYQWVKLKSKKFFKEESTTFAWFLFGNVIGIFFLAKFMDVNYPQDRVAIHLVLFALLMFAFLINKFKYRLILSLSFLYFPITLIYNLSLTTSVFGKEERMLANFHNKIKENLDKYSTLSTYPYMEITWAYNERNYKIENSIQTTNSFNLWADVLITKSNQESVFKKYLKDYDTLAYDPQNNYLAFISKTPFIKTTIFKEKFKIETSNEEFLNIKGVTIPDSLREYVLQISLSAKFKIMGKSRNLNAVISTFDSSGNAVRYYAWDERWSHGQKTEFEMNVNYIFGKLIPEEKEIRMYIWNPQRTNVKVNDGCLEIMKIQKK